MQKLLLFVIVLFYVSLVQGQPSKNLALAGKVTDAQTGQPLAGANVHIADARIGAVTNNNGEYSFKNIPSGHHVIEVSFSGFNTTVLHVDVNESSTRDFALTAAVREQQGITITGVAQATNVRNSPVPVSIMRKAEMLQTPATNIIDL
ncbi:MAG TPA: carboxypeptidase-like regulatory domain-containing protein, partial [Flavisolibacter sp.]|nr:carboxypeptidase-like regulatory domain-containing protein [Flavisolibacter sp.]